jgi:hypothetical protein
MTAPGNGFGTHNCDSLRLASSIKSSRFFRNSCLCIGEATEAGVMPSGVDGIMARMPEATQTGHVAVMTAGGMQGRRQFATVELRIVPRTWDGAYVDQSLHQMRFQKLDEFL